MRNSPLLTIASASTATVAAVPALTPNAVNTEAANPTPQTTQVRGYNSDIWYAGTMQFAETQPAEIVVIKTDKEYKRVLEQARKDAVSDFPLFFSLDLLSVVFHPPYLHFILRSCPEAEETETKKTNIFEDLFGLNLFSLTNT